MKIRKLYYKGYKKAFNVTYDDGATQDVRLVELLNKYGIIGTFNLNTKLILDNYKWILETGMDVFRLNKEQVLELYVGHEIASHSYTHKGLPGQDRETIMTELVEDKKNLEEWFNHEIKGFSYPFGVYNELTTQCVKEAGFVYARIEEETEDFSYLRNPLIWKYSFYHVACGLESFVQKFAECNEELALCQIAGHSYELDMYKKWESVENAFSLISQEKDVWFASNIDIVEYLEAMKSVKISEQKIVNPSDKDLWFEIDGKVKIVKSLSEMKV